MVFRSARTEIVSPKLGQFSVGKLVLKRKGDVEAIRSYADEALATAIATRTDRYLVAKLSRSTLGWKASAQVVKECAKNMNRSQSSLGENADWVHGYLNPGKYGNKKTLWTDTPMPEAARRFVRSLTPGMTDGPRHR